MRRVKSLENTGDSMRYYKYRTIGRDDADGWMYLKESDDGETMYARFERGLKWHKKAPHGFGVEDDVPPLTRMIRRFRKRGELDRREFTTLTEDELFAELI